MDPVPAPFDELPTDELLIRPEPPDDLVLPEPDPPHRYLPIEVF